MKKRRMVFFILVAVMVMIGSMSTFAASSANNRKAMKAYKTFLTRNRYGYHGMDLERFAVVDVNRDGVKELIAIGSKMRRIFLFTYRNGAVKNIFDGGGNLWAYDQRRGDYLEYNKAQNALVIRSHGGTGLYGYELWKMKNGKLKETLEIEYSYDGMRNKTSYSFLPKNGRIWRTISRSKYQRYYNQYFAPKRVTKIFFNINTATKRNKKLR